MLLKTSELKCLYEHFSYQYDPGVTVQCLSCHCIHAAYQYVAPAPRLCIPWGNTHTQVISHKSLSANAHTQAHTKKYKHLKKRQIRLILTKLCVGKMSTDGHTHMDYRYFRVYRVGICGDQHF